MRNIKEAFASSEGFLTIKIFFNIYKYLTMKNLLTIILVLLYAVTSLLGQPYPKTYYTSLSNQFNLPHGVASQIWSERTSPIFRNRPTTIFASGIWLGALDANDQIKIAATTYHTSGYDFVAGPIDLNKSEAENTITAKYFDKFWTVTALDIAQHREDFKDGKIDNPNPNIMAWVAKGNPNFEQYNGFKNEYDNQDLAPFKDVNNDGIYTPMQGDYPIVKQADEAHQPDEIFWSIFNDNCVHILTKGQPMNVEIQQTGWTYSCSDNPVLNNTNFLSFKVLNKGTEALDSLFMGYWSDFDLGCYNDDYVGCSPANNAFFAYNAKDTDGDSLKLCPGGVTTFKQEGVPTVSVTVLNNPMYSFIHYNNSSVGAPPIGTGDPTQSSDYYKLINAIWNDGTPMTRGGNGYKSSSDKTKFMFDGNPNDSTAWSQKTAKSPRADTRCMGSTYLKSLPPGDEKVIDLALSLHYDNTKKTTAGQINEMYNNFSKTQNTYNQRFTTNCQKTICPSDCVFPGDANNDGRADAKDFLTIAQQPKSVGITRSGSILWEARTADNWGKNNNLGLDLKYLDCDGNGVVEIEDRYVLENNFFKNHSKFQAKPDVILKNDQLAFKTLSNVDSLNIGFFSNGVSLRLNTNFPKDSVFGLAFELAYDSRFFNQLINPTSNRKFYKYIIKNPTKELHFATYSLTDNTFKLGFSDNIINNKQELPSACTELRFKNIQVIRFDGSILSNVGARDATFCFDKQFVATQDFKVNLHISIFPNPFENQLIIENNNTQHIDYQILNIQGQLLKKGNILAENRQTIDTHFLPKGIYFIELKGENGARKVEKLVK